MSKLLTALRLIRNYLFVWGFMYLVFVGEPLWDGLLQTIYNIISSSKYKIYIPLLMILELMVLTSLVFHKRKIYSLEEKTDIRTASAGRVALLIPTHKSEDVIKTTLDAALLLFKPHEIFIMDNGNNANPLDSTGDICREYGVNYRWIPYGYKLSALYIGAQVAKDYEFIFQIDDDVILSEELVFPLDDSVQCISYAIGATSYSGNVNWYHKFQDTEYKFAGLYKGIESDVCSITFAHGAISLWRRETYIDVIRRQPTYPFSEDWYTGFYANLMGKRISIYDSEFTNTDVPSSYYPPLCKKKKTNGGYGDLTIWSQRFGRWYKLVSLQFLYLTYYLLFSWKLPFRKIIFQKLLWLWVLFTFFAVMFKWILIMFAMFTNPFYVSMILLANLVLNLIVILAINHFQLRDHEKLYIRILPVYVLYKMMDTTNMMLSMIYHTLFWIPYMEATMKFRRIDDIINIIEIDGL